MKPSEMILRKAYPVQSDYQTVNTTPIESAILDYLDSQHKEEPKKRWRAEEHGKYWCAGVDGIAYADEEQFTYYDNAKYDIGNYFRTEAEAQEAADKFRQLLLSMNG